MEGESSAAKKEILMHWKNVLNKKLDNHTQDSNNFLTNNELENIIPLIYVLGLNIEEQAFVEKSRMFRNAETQQKRRRLLFWILFFVFLSFITTSSLFWMMYKNCQISQELVQNQQIIKTVFHQNRFILSSQQDSTGQFKYGFIDQEGIVRIPYQYDEASNFDEYGFARVKIRGALYLIDTLNHRYPLAESLQNLNDTILALNLREQQLSIFPTIISENRQLEILYLRGNYFSIFPANIEQLTKLKVLDLGYNQLTKVPDAFSAFKQLKILDLRYNLLTKLDSSLLELPALEILNLSGNFIEKIPREINQLKELRILNLSNNQIAHINNVAELPKLRELNVYNNNIDSIPQVLVQKTELVIHWGGHKMKKQSQSDAYKNNNKSNDNEVFVNLNKKQNNISTNIPQNNSNTTKSSNETTSNNTISDNFRYQVLKIAGENQSASAHEQLDGAIKVRVVNPFSQPLAGVTVLFEVASGGGHVSERNVITDKEGLAQVFWVVGADGEQVLNVTAMGDSIGKKPSVTQVFKAISHYIVDERDGEAYAIVKIGTQTWMAENLRYNAKGSKLNPKNKNIRYGRLYDWNTLMGNYNPNALVNQGLCPKGWHIPTQKEWEILRETKTPVTLKSSHHWDSKNEHLAGLLNSSGFNALPAGKYNRLTNTFSEMGAKAFFWSATEVTVMYAIYYQLYMGSGATDVLFPREDIDKDNGLSCRCIKDEG